MELAFVSLFNQHNIFEGLFHIGLRKVVVAAPFYNKFSV